MTKADIVFNEQFVFFPQCFLKNGPERESEIVCVFTVFYIYTCIYIIFLYNFFFITQQLNVSHELQIMNMQVKIV